MAASLNYRTSIRLVLDSNFALGQGDHKRAAELAEKAEEAHREECQSDCERFMARLAMMGCDRETSSRSR